MGPEAPNWLESVREFRKLVSEHAHMEEEQVFPRFKQAMTEEQNAQITSLMNRDGFWMALADQRELRRVLRGKVTLPSPAMRSIRAASSPSSAKSRPAMTTGLASRCQRDNEADAAVGAPGVDEVAGNAYGHRERRARERPSAAGFAWQGR